MRQTNVQKNGVVMISRFIGELLSANGFELEGYPMTNRQLVSVVVPVFNERDNVQAFYEAHQERFGIVEFNGL